MSGAENARNALVFAQDGSRLAQLGEQRAGIAQRIHDRQIKFAGLGYAMANAREEVRAQADRIAPSNHEDGVAQVIMQLLKEGKIGKGA